MKKSNKNMQKSNMSSSSMQKNPSFKNVQKTSCSSTMSTSKKMDTKSSSNKKTVVRVYYDCGFPNTMFIRGAGTSALSWNKGSPMKNISNNEWVWETCRPCTNVEFKVLINDEIYENGNNHMMSFGDEMSISPNF